MNKINIQNKIKDMQKNPMKKEEFSLPIFYKIIRSHKYFIITTIFCAICLSLFAGIFENVVMREPIVQVDYNIINFIQIHRIDFLNNFFIFITGFGNLITALIVFFTVAILLIFFRRYTFLVAISLAMFGDGIFVYIIKNLVQRARPNLSNALIPESGFSFPSGHTFIAVCLYGLITYFLFKIIKNKIIKLIILVTGILLILLISFSRIYIGVHYPSDVLSSLFFSLAYISILIYLIERDVFNRLFQYKKVELKRIKG